MRMVLRSKIHNAYITEANLHYVGSITIDTELLERVGLWPGERVLVVSNTNGARLETYVIAGEPGSGVICMNGAAAHLVQAGHQVIIMGFELSDKPVKAKVILVDEHNHFAEDLTELANMKVPGRFIKPLDLSPLD
jgi:aspartate 1-decarboxylase